MAMATDLLSGVTLLGSASARVEITTRQACKGPRPSGSGRLLIKPSWWAGSAPVSRPNGQIPGRAPATRAKRFTSHARAKDRNQPCQPAPSQPPRDLQTIHTHWTGPSRLARTPQRYPLGGSELPPVRWTPWSSPSSFH
jgi:hypothetical protein